MKLLLKASLTAAVLSVLVPSAAGAAWLQPVGGDSPINREADRNGSQPSIGEFSGVPYVAWAETDGSGVSQIQAARLDVAGSAWERPEDAASPINLAPNEDAENPTLRRDDPGASPCVAFDEANGSATQIHMSCLTTATEWTTVGDSPNKDPAADAAEPSLTLFDGITWVAWSEVDTDGVNQIRVAKLPAPGTTWVRVPDTVSPINAVATENAFGPSLTAVGGKLYVSWTEVDVSGGSAGEVSQIHVAVLDETSGTWDQVGGVLNRNSEKDAFDPRLADVGGVPYVAWAETDPLGFDQVRVARLQGSSWDLVADSASPINEAPEQDAEHPSLVGVGGTPYVAWSEPNATAQQIRVARLNGAGTAWEKVADSASPINQSSELNASEPSLIEIGGFPYLGWSEIDEEDVGQVRATRLVPEFLSQGAVGVTAGDATLETEARTYGLPFPITFEYGLAPAELETTPVPAPTGQGEVVTVSQPVAGLSAKSGYQARPFATVGIAQPRVLGPGFSFQTPGPTHVLTVQLAGAGSVTSSPAGIDCGPICTAPFEAGLTVTLNAVPAPGSEFTGWAGGGCAGTGSCEATLSDETTVRAGFARNPSPPIPPDGPPVGGPPSTRITKAKVLAATGRASFRFTAIGGPAQRFQCALAKRASQAKYKGCRSPRTYSHLGAGRYVFKVRAVSAAGIDSSPAVRRFRIVAAR